MFVRSSPVRLRLKPAAKVGHETELSQLGECLNTRVPHRAGFCPRSYAPISDILSDFVALQQHFHRRFLILLSSFFIANG
jgi:hypothetical protein